LIPLFLLWIYVTWLIVLFGLILTYTLQTLGGRSLRRVELTDENSLLVADPDWMLPIMCEVGHAFATGNAINHQQLADRIGLSSRIVHDMTNKLVDAQLLRRVSGSVGQQDAVTLSRPAEKIAIGEILALAHRVRPTSDHPAWKTLAGLKQAEREAADGKTLANVLLW
jgi:membrane protein